jgi:hypothetical protein
MKNAKELFEKYQEADDAVQKARQTLDEAMDARTSEVEKIVQALGKGPFQFGGKSIQAVKRNSKDESGKVTGATWYFKTVGKEVQVID